MISKKFFNSLFPTAGLNPGKYNLVRRRDELIAALNKFLPQYKINSHKRICAFLANCGIETDYFKTTEEYASGWAYDISVNPRKARELGNYKKGDGPRYKGSGLSQTTGGYNFGEVQKAIGKRLGIDVVKNPEILRENIDVAVESACIFWDDHKLNSFADRGEFKQLSAIVNRGDKNKTPLHWAKRNELYSKLLRYVPRDFSFSADVQNVKLTSQNYDDPTRIPHPSEIISPLPSLPITDQTITTATAEPTTAPETDQSKIKTTVDKYLKHAKTDSAKNIFLVIASRIGAGISALWTVGITGKLFLILISGVVVGSLIYALVYYRKRFIGWISAVLASWFE